MSTSKQGKARTNGARPTRSRTPTRPRKGDANYQSANALNNAVRQLLADYGCKEWRNNTGAAVYKGGERKDGTHGRDRFVRFGERGQLDIFAINPLGLFVCVETKVGGDTARPEQIEFADEINALGGIAIFTDSLDDCERQYLELLNARMADFTARAFRYRYQHNRRRDASALTREFGL